ncbi:hypothetical protein [Clostridium sp.]|uniref:hypothetical protein n=1 Tax=Clostridium sp. TaxID=1506 RepID=UPI0028506D56|nr:hypothetical protein [Clostridium sp.]MDR3596838.1 hypothetical protein [Clostridium sp.]
MNKERTPYSPTPGDYDTEKLTNLHSPDTQPSHYARNIQHTTDVLRTKDSYNSSDRSIKNENRRDTTERIPTLIKYSDMKDDDDDADFKGKI